MRSYRQHCGVAKALDLVGSRWALLLVRDLLPGPRRFTELLMPGLTRAVLSQRLKELAAAGVVERVPVGGGSRREAWALTEQGRALEPVVLALGAFGARALPETPEDAVRLRWFMVSLGRRYQGGVEAGELAVVSGDDAYVVEVTPEALTARDGTCAAPRARVAGPVRTLVSAWQGRPAPSLRVEGDTDWWRRVVGACAG